MAIRNSAVQTQVTTKPTGVTPKDTPGTTNGVGRPAFAAAMSADGLPRSCAGSVMRGADAAKAPITNEASCKDKVAVIIDLSLGLVALIWIVGDSRACILVLRHISDLVLSK